MKCSKCGGTGNIPQYHYYHNGVCFNCWGTGKYLFKERHPALDKQFSDLREKDTTYFDQVYPLFLTAVDLDDLLQQAILTENSEDIAYYEAKFSEQLTHIFNARKGKGQ